MNRSIFAVPAVLVMTATFFSIVTPALPVFAQQTNPCTKDFKEVCSDVTPGSGRLVRCYEERKDKMSPACVAWAERAKANAATLQETCAKEIDRSCNFEKGDPFAMLDCLQSNYINLSNDCRVKLNAFKGMYPKPNPDRSQ